MNMLFLYSSVQVIEQLRPQPGLCNGIIETWLL